MKLVFASDSFKGSLTSRQTAELLEKAAHEVFGSCETVSIPVADGGEGTVDAVCEACRGEIVRANVKDPLMRDVWAKYCIVDSESAEGPGGKTAVIEMAEASGLTLVEEKLRDPLAASTYGTGQLILDALDRGCREISIAIGGSATNDGGTGCLRALGMRFLDGEGRELSGCGADLEKIEKIDGSKLDPRLKDTKITVMCDVTNPLTGPDGATMVFGPQKGAGPESLEKLERGMENYDRLILEETGTDCSQLPGAGAAGGLGAALIVLLGGEMRSGVEVVLDMVGFDEKIKGADLIVTGEGRTDRQSVFGKVMMGVGMRAKKAGIRAVGLSGSTGDGYEEIFRCGISSLTVTIKEGMSVSEAMDRAAELYEEAAAAMFRRIAEER